MSDGHVKYCSFCGKSEHEVRVLIAGPTVFICNECTDICSEIVAGTWRKDAYRDAAFEVIGTTQGNIG